MLFLSCLVHNIIWSWLLIWFFTPFFHSIGILIKLLVRSCSSDLLVANYTLGLVHLWSAAFGWILACLHRNRLRGWNCWISTCWIGINFLGGMSARLARLYLSSFLHRFLILFPSLYLDVSSWIFYAICPSFNVSFVLTSRISRVGLLAFITHLHRFMCCLSFCY